MRPEINYHGKSLPVPAIQHAQQHRIGRNAPSLMPKQPDDQRQDDTNDYHARNREIEGKVIALHDNVAG